MELCKPVCVVANRERSENWWPFPPPSPGIYNVRQPGLVYGSTAGLVSANAHVTAHGVGKYESMHCMGMNAATEMKVRGYEFQFIGDEVWTPKINAQSDIHLPIAHSIEEARYIVRKLPELWPQLNRVHVEYVETIPPLSSAPITDDAP